MADDDSKSQLEMASQLGDFATTLFQVIGRNSPGNMCISPFCVATLLDMIQVGAKGRTAKQLKEALGLGKFFEQEVYTTLKNMMIHCEEVTNMCCIGDEFEIKDKFETQLEKNCAAMAEKVRLSNTELCKISSWEFGNENVKEILSKDSIDQTTAMFLLNYVSFEGDWSEKFHPKLTKIKPFFLNSENSKVDVEMMSCLNRTCRTGEIDSLDARFIELPYNGQKLSMVIILPNKMDGVTKVESNLSGKVLDEMEKNASQKKLCVELPKFQIETKVEDELKNALRGMGIKDLFTSELADLSGLFESPGLFASNIVQKCVINVDEKGVETTAAIAVTIMAESAPQPVPSFKVDHPAIFLVKDDVTKLILFIGRLANPAQK